MLTEQDYEQHSKCCHCGTRNGLWGRPLEQHTTRCYYKGYANSKDVTVPNHNQLIKEDDEIFLPMMRALIELPVVKSKLEKLERDYKVLWEKLNPPKDEETNKEGIEL